MSFRGYKTFYYWLKAKLFNLLDLPGRIRCYFQRANRGYADSDLWNFDYYLATIIIEGLEKLKKNQHILPTWELSTEPEEVAQKRWNDIMDQMIVAFKYAKLYIDMEIPPKEWEEKYKPDYDKGMELFKEHFFSLWD